MAGTEGSDSFEAEWDGTDKHYDLSVSTQAGRLTIRVKAGTDGRARFFPSLLLAFDYIERDLAASQLPRSRKGLQ